MAPLLLTHTDLDGLGCAVLFQGAGSASGRVELVENGAIEQRVLAAIGDEEDILVTDHGLSSATADLVDGFVARGGRFLLLDHHRAPDRLESRRWAKVDESRSATGLLFDQLGRPARFREFSMLVEDHDLWIHADPRSAELSALVGLLGHERFLSRFRDDPSVEFREGERLLLDSAAQRREEYLQKKVQQAEVLELVGGRWAVCYAEEYQSDLAERLMTELGVTMTAIVNPGKRTVSLRSRGEDVSEIARRFGGGGHARAAAFTFRRSELELRLEGFEQALAEELAPQGS